MSNIIRAGSTSSPVAETQLIRFDIVKLEAGQSALPATKGFETHLVPLSGTARIRVEDRTFGPIGGRASVWDGVSSSLYAGTSDDVEITAESDLEIAVAAGRIDGTFAPFLVSTDDVSAVQVGSSGTKSRRTIHHLLGQNGEGRAGNMLISELYAEEGCWSGYPPHKHDTDTLKDGEVLETDHDELYHYRFFPETGFGAQFLYDEGEEPKVEMTRNGDTFLVTGGHHPTVTSPGHREYIFTILVGRTRRGLVQNFEEKHRHLIGSIPGIGDMTAAFK